MFPFENPCKLSTALTTGTEQSSILIANFINYLRYKDIERVVYHQVSIVINITYIRFRFTFSQFPTLEIPNCFPRPAAMNKINQRLY